MPRHIFSASERRAARTQAALPQPDSPSGPSEAMRENALAETTLENIGIPDDLIRVDIRKTHDINHYRVNVYCTRGGQPKITDSFYVAMTDEGLMAWPPMDKKYYTFDELDAILS